MNWDFTVSKSLINSLGSYKYIIHYKYLNQQHWLNVHSTVGFFTCHNGCPVCRESRWKLKLGAHEGAPGGLVPSPPHPSSPLCGLEKGPVLRLVPAMVVVVGGFKTHNPSSHLPLPSCSGWCLNASTSHLGLPKPVLTAEGGSMESTHP